MKAPTAFDRMSGKPLGEVSIAMGVTLWVFYGLVMLAEGHLRLRDWWRGRREARWADGHDGKKAG